MRVLIYLNPMMFDKVGKGFKYDKDSGFLFTRHVIQNLPINWFFTVLVPASNFPRSFFSEDHRIEYVPYDYQTSVQQNRFHFNTTILSNALPYTKDIDVVINNQPEVTNNLRVFFRNQRREEPVIINFFHWIDCPESNKGDNYIFRQLEALFEADMNLFHSDTAYKLMLREMNRKIVPGNFQYNIYSPPPTTFGEVEFDLMTDKKIILFNHRLNSTTGWKEVLWACGKIREDRDDFVLWFTDTRNRVPELKNYSWIINRDVDDASYGYLLKKSHLCVTNTRGYMTWNMALLDAVNHGCHPVMWFCDLYRDMVEGGTFFTASDDMIDSIEHILDMEEPPKANITQGFFGTFNIERFVINCIKRKLSLRKTKPAKYDDVIRLIREHGSCSKAHFVNKFWNFHANSNFQLIRWIILLEEDDILDNINCHLTEYYTGNKKQQELGI